MNIPLHLILKKEGRHIANWPRALPLEPLFNRHAGPLITEQEFEAAQKIWSETEVESLPLLVLDPGVQHTGMAGEDVEILVKIAARYYLTDMQRFDALEQEYTLRKEAAAKSTSAENGSVIEKLRKFIRPRP